MAKFQQIEGLEPSKGPHVDYPTNLKAAKTLCNRVSKALPEGMRVYVSNSQELVESLLMVSFRPPPQAKMGNCATPIFLHQPSREYNTEVEKVVNLYFKVANHYWKLNPKQPSLL